MIELGKKYQTSDGRKIRLLVIDTDPSDAFPVIGFCYSPRANGSEYLQRWSRHGAALYKEEDDTCDLVPVPTKREGWVIIDDLENVSFFTTKEYAQEVMDARKCYGAHKKVVLFRWED